LWRWRLITPAGGGKGQAEAPMVCLMQSADNYQHNRAVQIAFTNSGTFVRHEPTMPAGFLASGFSMVLFEQFFARTFSRRREQHISILKMWSPRADRHIQGRRQCRRSRLCRLLDKRNVRVEW
jgi:hypothetical protein